MKRFFIILSIAFLCTTSFAQKRWSVVSTFTEGFDPYFLNENFGFLASSGSGSLLRTTNAGKTWTNISGSLGTGVFGIGQIYFESANHIYLSSNGNDAIYESFDGGITWKSLHYVSPQGIYAVNGVLYD